MNIKQIAGLLALIIIPIALIVIIQKSMQVDYSRSIHQGDPEKKLRTLEHTSPNKKLVTKEPLENHTPKVKHKVIVRISKSGEENKSGQIDSNRDPEKKKGERYVSIGDLIPKETYSYKYSPSKQAELVGSTSSPKTTEENTSEDSAQTSSSEPTGDKQILRDIQTECLGKKLIITILSNTPIKEYRKFSLTSPPRFVIDLYGRWSVPKISQPNNTNDLVKGIRFGLYPDKLRFVLDLKSALSIEPTIILTSADTETTASN
jgi:hypothetical protein